MRAERLVAEAARVVDGRLVVRDRSYGLKGRRVAVVGAGKAGAGMVAGLEQALAKVAGQGDLAGWVNVPADCVRQTQWVHLCAARPPGVNEPTPAAVEGTREILRTVSSLDRDDLCIVLLSGGGSALLCAPVDGITLDDKIAVTRLLSRGGATIEELNRVRRALSEVKGGGLLRACRAGTMIVLLISDVVGDPLETIASGPTAPSPTTAADAAAVLRRFAPDRSALPERVWSVLERATAGGSDVASAPSRSDVQHFVLGNNRVALEAAADAARQLGYRVVAVRPEEQGEAQVAGRTLAEEALRLRQSADAPLCLITGGEPVVHIDKQTRPGKGGRNQELVLAAVERLWNESSSGIVTLSGGTDGEDGPTDAAGAVADSDLITRAHELRLQPEDFLERHDSYPFFEQTGGLLLTGPTHTNVMDVRVVLVNPERKGSKS